MPQNCSERRNRAVLRGFRPGLLLASLALLACAGSVREPRVTTDGLVEVRAHSAGTLFADPVDHVDYYDGVMIGRFGIDYADGQEELPKRVVSRLREQILEAARATVPERGYPIADQAGPCTLALNLYLVDLELYRSERAGGRTTFLRSYGAVTVVIEFRDSIESRPVLRYVQRKDLGGGSQEGLVTANLGRLDQAVDEIVSDASDGMLRALRGTESGESPRPQCQGLVGEARRAARS